MSQIIQECTFRGFLYGIICPEFGVYDRIPGAEIFAVRSQQKEPTANQTEGSRGDAKAVVRNIGEDELKRLTSGDGILQGRTDERGSFCINDRRYQGELVDVYICLRVVPGPNGKQLPLERTVCLFLGTYRPAQTSGSWYVTLFVPQSIWCKLKKLVDAWTVAGRVATCDGDQPLGQVKVIARDVDITQDDLLGEQVGRVLLVHWRYQRYALADAQTEARYAFVLALIVGHQAHASHAKVAEDLRSNGIVAPVDCKT